MRHCLGAGVTGDLQRSPRGVRPPAPLRIFPSVVGFSFRHEEALQDVPGMPSRAPSGSPSSLRVSEGPSAPDPVSRCRWSPQGQPQSQSQSQPPMESERDAGYRASTHSGPPSGMRSITPRHVCPPAFVFGSRLLTISHSSAVGDLRG